MLKVPIIESRLMSLVGFMSLLQIADSMKVAGAHEQQNRGIKHLNRAIMQMDEMALQHLAPVEQSVAIFKLHCGTHVGPFFASQKDAVTGAANALRAAFRKSSVKTRVIISSIARLMPVASTGDEPEDFQGGCDMHSYAIFCFRQRTASCS